MRVKISFLFSLISRKKNYIHNKLFDFRSYIQKSVKVSIYYCELCILFSYYNYYKHSSLCILLNVPFATPLPLGQRRAHFKTYSLKQGGTFCLAHKSSAQSFCFSPLLYGDNVIEKHGINRDRTGDREKTRYLCGKQGIFTRDRALIRPGFIRQLETRASTRSASFFHALGSPGRPHNGGGAAGAYRTRNGAKPLKQGHLRAKRGPLGPSRKSQQQTKRTGFAAHGHSIAETAPEGKRASCANGALIRA